MQEIPAPQQIPIAVAWCPLDASWHKINFDGALFVKENCAGVGVVIRNGQGLVMASLSQKVPLPFTVIEVEALAARRAVKFCCRTWFGSDCIGRGLRDTRQHLTTWM